MPWYGLVLLAPFAVVVIVVAMAWTRPSAAGAIAVVLRALQDTIGELTRMVRDVAGGLSGRGSRPR